MTPPSGSAIADAAARTSGRRLAASADAVAGATPGGITADSTPEELLAALTAEGGPLLAGLPAPAPAEGIELLGSLSGSGHRTAPGLVRRPDGQTLQLTTLLYALLELVDGRRTYADIAAELGTRLGRDVAATDVCFLAEAKLRPLGVLASADGSSPEGVTSNPLLGLRCKFVVSDPARTRRITAPFARLFHPLVVGLVLAAFALITGWLAFDKGMASATHQAFYSPELLLLVFGLTVVSAGFHEFGHAAACRYGGATPGAMGAGLYLVWPAFYTDVSDSYRLGRAGRLRVDLGGLYFNAIFAVGIFGVWSVLRWDALLLVIGTQILQMIRQLTPLVRFDGYHILADLTGVPDLFSHIKPTLLGLLPSRWGRAEHKVLKPWARAVVTIWVLAVVPLLLGLLVLMIRVLPRLAATAWDSFGLHWEQLVANWIAQDPARVGVGLLALLALTLPVASVTYLLLRIGRRFTRWAWRASADSRPGRTAVVLGALALVGAIGWMWASDGATPIDGTEGGTLTDAFAGLLPPPDDEGDAVAGVVGPDPWAVHADDRSPVRAGANRTVAAAGASAAPVAARGEAADRSRPGQAGRPEQTGPPAATGRPAETGPPADRGAPGDGSRPDVGPPADRGTPPAVTPPPDRGRPGDPDPDPDPEPDPRDPWPFPFDPPGPVGDGDNRAYAVNTTDGSVVEDVAFSLVRASEGPIHHRNEAWALAQCRDCKTVAVAFQVVLLETDDIRVVAPVNHSVALNHTCESCVTHGVAVQLVVTLTDAPSPQVLGEIRAVIARLQHLRGQAAALPLGQVHAELVGAKAEVLAILAREAPDADVVEDVQLEDGTEELDADPAEVVEVVEEPADDDESTPQEVHEEIVLADPDDLALDDAVDADADAVDDEVEAGIDESGAAPAEEAAEPDPTPSPDPSVADVVDDVAVVHEDDGELSEAGKPPVDAADVEPEPEPEEEQAA